MTYEERAALNYDHPDAFDTGLMVDDLRKLAFATFSLAIFLASVYNVHGRERIWGNIWSISC